MAAFRFSIRAERDLMDLTRYSLAMWGDEQTLLYLSDLEDCCQKLADQPSLGRACEEIRPGLRRMEHASHVIFFRLEPEGIMISRVLHQCMLPGRQRYEDG